MSNLQPIQQAYEAIAASWVTPALFGISIFFALLIFLINFKRKSGLIYISIALILVGVLLILISSFITFVLNALLPDYVDIVMVALEGVFTGMRTIGLVYLVVAVALIVLFIVLKVIGKKKAKTAEAPVVSETVSETPAVEETPVVEETSAIEEKPAE